LSDSGIIQKQKKTKISLPLFIYYFIY